MSDKASSKYVGRSVLRHENEALLRGTGQFVDDVLGRPGTLHAAILRSPHAHADILAIDTAAAKALPGVYAVLTARDIAPFTQSFLIGFKTDMEYWALAVDRVRYVGDPIAIVVATDRYIAEDALDLIHVTYRVLPAVVDTMKALEPDAPVLHPKVGSNLVSKRNFIYGDPDAAFAAATHRTSLHISYPRNSIMPLEGYAVLAEYESGSGIYDVLCNFHGPFSLHAVMARGLKVDGSRLRIRTARNSGGSFGTKLTIFPYVVLLCIAARVVRRPVKWIEDRLENLSSSCSAPSRVTYLEAAHDSLGRISALKFDHYDDHGAYLRAPMPAPIYRMHGIQTSCYDIRNINETINIVVTNRIPSGAVRGFGGPQHYFGLERLMHQIARQLGHDRLDVIRRNLVPAGSFPYRAPGGALLDSGDYDRVISDTVDKGGLRELQQRQAEARAQGRFYGIGFAAAIEPSTSNMGYIATLKTPEERRKIGPKNGNINFATVNVDPLGGVTVRCESAAQGQGHETAIAQIVADELGLRPEEIVVHVDVDTGKDAWSIAAGNYSSRFSAGTTGAVVQAARKARDKLARIALAKLNTSLEDVEFVDGMIRSRLNPANAIAMYRVAGEAHWSPESLPGDMEPGINVTAAWSPPELTPTTDRDEINSQLTYGFGFDFCGVEIDRDTAAVRIDKFVSGHDCGVIINPALAKGQIEGSFASAVGAALYEEFVYGDDGSFLTGTFADYLIATAAEMPRLTHVETICSPSPFTPLGAKGLAEGNCFSTPVCIANAVADALSLDDVQLPLTPSRMVPFVFGSEEVKAKAGAPRPAAAGSSGKGLSGEGTTRISAPVEEIWAHFMAPERLASIIPGCSKLEETGPNAYRATVLIGVGPVRGEFTATVRLTDLVKERALRLVGELTGALGASQGEGRISLSPEGEGTSIAYQYEVRLQGKVAAVGGRMLRGAARALIASFFEGLEGKLGRNRATGAEGKTSWWRRFGGSGT